MENNIKEKDFFTELASRSSQKLHKTLSQLTGEDLPKELFNLTEVEVKEKDVVLDVKDKCFGVYSQISEPYNGAAIVFFPLKSISSLVNLVQNNFRQKKLLPEMRLSAFKEIGNIITSTYVTELANLSDKKIHALPPSLIFFRSVSLSKIVSSNDPSQTSNIIFIGTLGETTNIVGKIVLFFDKPSFQALLETQPKKMEGILN